MSLTDAPDLFAPAESADPAVPGDPFTRLRFFYGQLLSAHDFTAEQRAHLLRHRLHLALLHGFGTVWGLRVYGGPPGEVGQQTEIVVGEGLAVDALGREIYVNQEQCLDVSALHVRAGELWNDLTQVDEASSNVRRAYVVLSYLACLSERAPGISPPCADERDLNPFSRVNDRFRLDLVASPPDPGGVDLVRRWAEADGPRPNTETGSWSTVRDALVDFVINAGRTDLPPLSAYWLQTADAPLLLASVDLRLEDGGAALVAVSAVDNTPRAILPPVQLVAEQVFGHRLAGADDREPLTLVSVETDMGDDGPQLLLRFSHTLHEGSTNAAVTLRVLTEGEWSDGLATVEMSNPDGDGEPPNSVLKVTSTNAFDENVIYQLRVSGAGPDPLVSQTGEPLAGWWSEGVRPNGGPRDIAIVRTWPSTD